MKYPAAQRITWLEWSIFGLLLVAAAAIAGGLAWLAVGGVVWLVRALKG